MMCDFWLKFLKMTFHTIVYPIHLVLYAIYIEIYGFHLKRLIKPFSGDLGSKYESHISDYFLIDMF